MLKNIILLSCFIAIIVEAKPQYPNPGYSQPIGQIGGQISSIPISSSVPIPSSIPISSSVPIPSSIPISSSVPISSQIPISSNSISSIPISPPIPISSIPISQIPSQISPQISPVPENYMQPQITNYVQPNFPNLEGSTQLINQAPSVYPSGSIQPIQPIQTVPNFGGYVPETSGYNPQQSFGHV